ncbi:hypothetical protein AAG570_009925 [Ranatra chinensis]|uniref:Shootin-1 n=1 Tax=Ranatra chinensis TaxID=642074 RepID=A0ABD0YQM7_9HEMI
MEDIVGREEKWYLPSVRWLTLANAQHSPSRSRWCDTQISPEHNNRDGTGTGVAERDVKGSISTKSCLPLLHKQPTMPLNRSESAGAESGPPSPVRESPSRNGMRTHIPVPMHTRKLSTESLVTSPNASHDKWILRFEDMEKRRKILIAQNQKVEREKEDLIVKNMKLKQQCAHSSKLMEEKEKELMQLRKLAESVFKEYDQLKNQYELDTGALQQAIQRASKWYRQNRELKRKSTALVQKVLQVAPEAMIGIDDVTDSGGVDQDEMENLQKSVRELNKEIARLQSELNAAKLQEFEAQEQAVELQSSLEEERYKSERLQNELDETRVSKENLVKITRLIAQEVSSLREQCQKEKENAQRLKSDADEAKRERNILAHQSQLLLADASSSEKLITALLEIENITRKLEEEKSRHETELRQLQEKMAEEITVSDSEMLTERLKIIESELDCVIKRAERSEAHNEELLAKVKHLELELEKKSVTPQSPPPPPPPPPPPLPPQSIISPSSQLPRRNASIKESQPNSVVEMANLLVDYLPSSNLFSHALCGHARILFAFKKKKSFHNLAMNLDYGFTTQSKELDDGVAVKFDAVLQPVHQLLYTHVEYAQPYLESHFSTASFTSTHETEEEVDPSFFQTGEKLKICGWSWFSPLDEYCIPPTVFHRNYQIERIQRYSEVGRSVIDDGVQKLVYSLKKNIQVDGD